MKTLNFLQLPERGAFDFAFARECPKGTYSIRHGSRGPEWRPPEGDYTREQLWSELQTLVKLEESGELETEDMREGREDSPGSWASSILYTLGFEWV